MVINTIPFTEKSFIKHQNELITGLPIVKRREGHKYQKVTFYKNTISLGITKTFKGQRYNEVIGHWPEMSISTFSKIANERVSRIELGFHDKAANLLVGDFFIDYILPMVKTHNRDVASVETRWRRMAAFIGPRYISNVSKIDILNFLNGLANEVKGATVNRHRSLLSLIFTTAVNLDLIIKNPCKGIKKWPEDNIRNRVLNDNEVYLYIEKAMSMENFHAKALLISLFLGLRIGNVLTIRREDIDENFETLTLPKTKNGRQYHVTLNSAAKQILKQCAKLSWNQWLFPSFRHQNRPIAYPRATHTIIEKYVLSKVNSGGHFTIHDLRRTYATRQIKLTGDIRLVQANLFHQNVATTERYTFHQRPEIAKASEDTAMSLLTGHQGVLNYQTVEVSHG